ncbi:MAG: hypothetical protein ACFFFG_05575 [Candidatus Thorarchaeota archaeon]
MINGLVVTTMTDMGPFPLLNLSELPEDTTVKLSVIGMTILSMGAGTVAEKQHYRLHGSIPVPDTPTLEALAMSFTVIPTDTKDIRIDQHGRESTIWLLFDSKMRDEIFQRHSAIEATLKTEAVGIREENVLSNPTIMKRVLSRIQDVSQSTEIIEPVSPEKEPVYLPSKGGLEFFHVNNQGELLELPINGSLTQYPILIICNLVIKRIILLKMTEDVSQRQFFLASKHASNLNSSRFKNAMEIRDVQDPLEREMILEKLGVILETV